MKRILICEDEAAIRGFVVINLRRAGYEIIETASGEEALKKYEEEEGRIDLALLDIMLPGMDGFAVCEQLRRRNRNIGIILLTARSQEEEKVLGFRKGADDYVTKPFSPSELLMRIEALLRRVDTSSAANELLQLGEFTMNLRDHTVHRNGVLIDLARMEFLVLQCFLTHPGEVISRTELLHRVWGEDFCGEDKIVDVNIRRIRMKIEDDPSDPKHLITVWGKGYSFTA